METHAEFFARIQAHLAAGGNILIATFTKATLYKPKHASYFTPVSGEVKSIPAVRVASGRKSVFVYASYVHFQ